MNVNLPRDKTTIRHMVASDLARFGTHKAVLLAVLLKVRKRGRGPIDFDAEQLWRDVARLADLYFWREKAQQQTIPNAALARLAGQLANALDRARALAKKDDIINDLFSPSYS